MFTVLSKTRNSNLYLIVAAVFVAIIAFVAHQALVSKTIASENNKMYSGSDEQALRDHPQRAGYGVLPDQIAWLMAEQRRREHTLVAAPTEIASDLSSDSVIVLNHQDRYDKMNKEPIPSYRPPLDVCYDVPIGEVAACRNASRASVRTDPSLVDDCFGFSLPELATCLGASQESTP